MGVIRLQSRGPEIKPRHTRATLCKSLSMVQDPGNGYCNSGVSPPT
jgi:hypothetical protein